MDCRHEFGAEEDCGETAMKIMKASPEVTLSAQLNEQILRLADDGVELVICNRPDDESDDQASFSVFNRQQKHSAWKRSRLLLKPVR